MSLDRNSQLEHLLMEVLKELKNIRQLLEKAAEQTRFE